MADTKISALSALTGANVDTAADVLPIVDTSVTTTKKILIDELKIALGAYSSVASGYNIAARTNATNPTYKIDITADELILATAGGVKTRLTSVNKTVDITASGELGRDTGSETASTWYYGWVLVKADGSASTAVLSTATALGSVTLPAGYTGAFGALVTAVRNNISGDFWPYRQKGFEVTYTAGAQDLVIADDSASPAVYTSLNTDFAKLVPPVAQTFVVHIKLLVNTGAGGTGSADSYLSIDGGTDLFCYQTATAGKATDSGSDTQLVRAVNTNSLHYKISLNASASDSQFTLSVVGFSLPGGGQ